MIIHEELECKVKKSQVLEVGGLATKDQEQIHTGPVHIK